MPFTVNAYKRVSAGSVKIEYGVDILGCQDAVLTFVHVKCSFWCQSDGMRSVVQLSSCEQTRENKERTELCVMLICQGVNTVQK